MTLKLYNTLTRKKEEFRPINPKEVGIYSCGPTVYWYQHIGNLRSYIFSDILRRVLSYNGFNVKHVINVTDVGHLTSDSDTGEDKLEEAAKKEGKSAGEISEFYFKVFREDFSKLNIIEPEIWCKATEHINEQIELIKKLEERGYTYKTTDGIYFDTSKFSEYGKLSRKKVEDLEGGKRVKLGEKKNKTDFALWKFSEKPGVRQQEWDSPWGLGFPGWHIECSAMSMKYLGEEFDIHTGGEDHIHIHHENEIAQSNCATGKQSVKFWMHGAFLILDKGKMSKSSGKIKTISELERDGFNPLAYRYFTYTAHYRKPLTWSEEGLKSASEAYNKIKNIVRILKDDGEENSEYLSKFEDKINDDLDMPGAIAVLWSLLRDKDAKGKLKTIERMDSVLGLDLLKKDDLEVPEEVREIAEERVEARTKKDWKKSDALRDKLNELGWVIKDTKEGYTLEKNE